MKRFALAIALIFSFGVGLFLPVTNLARVEAASVISIKYDDRYSFKSNVVFVVTESVTSYQLDSSKKDEAVLKKDASDAKTVIACGCGRAKVLL